MESARRSRFLTASVFLALYSICLLSLVPRLSLWLDEILDLIGVRFYDLPRLIRYIPTNSGGVPLGYLAQVASVRIFGFSTFSGRLPSAVFSILGAIGIALLARRFGLRWPLLALAAFCLFPLQFRYALEARPYSQALAISVFMTLSFLRLRERPTWTRSLVYCACIATGLYTQPYSVFVAVAHSGWAILSPGNPTRKRLLWTTGSALFLAALAFLPWYSYAHQFWRESIEVSHYRSTVDLKTPLMIVRELIGAGYPGAFLVLASAWAALAVKFRRRPDALFWILQLVCPVLLALLTDAVFGYFVAIRQMIFLLAPLAILFAAGLEVLVDRWPRPAVIFGGLLMVILVYRNIRFLSGPREDWAQPANLLAQEARRGRCAIFLPSDSVHLYEFFNPAAGSRACPSDLATVRSLTTAVSPYESAATQQQWKAHLSDLGFERRTLLDKIVRVELYERR